MASNKFNTNILLSGRSTAYTFLRYGKEIFNADGLAATFKTMNDNVKARAMTMQNAERAQQLENILNEAFRQASSTNLLEQMGDQLIQAMSDGALSGMAAAGIGYRGGLSARSIGSGARQAAQTYLSGQKLGKQYTTPTGALLAGNASKKYSSEWFMQQLNSGAMTYQQAMNYANGYKYLKQFNGEMLERFIQVAGSACFEAGQYVAQSTIDKILDALQGSVSSNSFGNFRTVGQESRVVTTAVNGDTLRVFDSQQKVDATMNVKFSDSEDLERITISAKSRSNKQSEVELLKNGNLMALLSNAGVAIDKYTYSALTIYTDNDVGGLLETLNKTIVMQAIAGTTGLNGEVINNSTVFDQADYMVMQVGSTNTTAPFRVISVYDTFLNIVDIGAQLDKFTRIQYKPSPPPLGSNTQGLDKSYDPPPRTGATVDALFAASVSVTLKKSFLLSLYW